MVLCHIARSSATACACCSPTATDHFSAAGLEIIHGLHNVRSCFVRHVEQGAALHALPRGVRCLTWHAAPR